MAIPLFVVDGFTDRPFSGNTAAVCLPGEERNDHCCLCPHREKPGKTIMTGFQASTRAGIVRVVHAGGWVRTVVTVLKGELAESVREPSLNTP